MSGRQHLGGMSTPPSAYDADTRVELNPHLDLGAVIRDAILGGITGIALVAGIFILLFIET